MENSYSNELKLNNLAIIIDEKDINKYGNLNNTNIESYLDELCSLGINLLADQSKNLEKQSKELNNSIKHVALNNYSSIIETSKFVDKLDLSLNEIKFDIDSFEKNISLFQNKLNNFTEDTKSISSRWKNASLMLNKHSKILEFLEIIQLLESCLRNNQYDEALKLLNYIDNLNIKHGDKIPLIADLAKKSSEWKETMINYLLKDLNSNNLDLIINSIDYLRRLSIFQESEIHLKFLSAKNIKLQNEVKALDNKNMFNFLKQMIEVYKKNLSETFEHYNKVFQTKEFNNKVIDKESNYYFDDSNSLLLSSWMILKVNNFINELKSGLSLLNKDDELFFEQIYIIFNLNIEFSNYLKNLGLYIKLNFDKIFDDYFDNDLKKNLFDIIDLFKKNLESYNIISSQIEKPNVNINTETLIFSPITNLINSINKQLDKLESKNINPTICFKLKFYLEKTIKETSNIVDNYIRSELTSLNEDEKKLLTKFKSEFNKTFINDLQNRYKKIISNIDAKCLFGIPSYEFSKIETENKISNYNELEFEDSIIN